MAEITLTGSNSKNVVSLASSKTFTNRLSALIYEKALNLRDTEVTATPSVNEAKWADAVLGGTEVNETAISRAIAVQADPATTDLDDTAADAAFRAVLEDVIDRCIDAWAAESL